MCRNINGLAGVVINSTSLQEEVDIDPYEKQINKPEAYPYSLTL